MLLGYCMEGIRLAGTFGAYREAMVDAVIPEDDGSEVPVKAKDRIFVSFVSFTPESLQLTPFIHELSANERDTTGRHISRC